MGYTNHTDHHPAPRTRWNEHTPDFFPDKATPTSQLMNLQLSTKTCEEIFNPCSQSCHFPSRQCQTNPKKPRPLPQGVMQAPLSCGAGDGMSWLPVLECSRLFVPGWLGRHLTPGQCQPRAGGSQWHRRAALLSWRCHREPASHASSSLRQDAGPKKAPCGHRMTRWAGS